MIFHCLNFGSRFVYAEFVHMLLARALAFNDFSADAGTLNTFKPKSKEWKRALAFFATWKHDHRGRIVAMFGEHAQLHDNLETDLWAV